MNLKILTSFCVVLWINSCLSLDSPKTIYITGLVGAGKTTFASLIKEKMPEVDILYEPAEKWLDVQGCGNLWDLFLKDGKRWALTTELYIPLARIQALEQILKKSSNKIIIIDRSIYEDCYVFAKIAYAQGTLSKLEWTIYQEWFAWVVEHTVKPKGFIYIRTTPKIALARMQTRGRTEEKDFPLSLQQQFYQYYEDLFNNEDKKPKELINIPTLIINADQDFKNDTVIQNECITAVKTFIKKV